jgi:imidazolonepropionase-like amidohydrolase
MPIRRYVLALLIVSALSMLLGSPQKPAADDIALVGGRIYASPAAMPIDDGVVIVKGGKIAAVGTRRSTIIPAEILTVNCSGKIITAGFQNSHVHFTEDKWTDAARQPASKLNTQLAAMLLRYGFTTVIDTGSLLTNTVALRRRIEARELIGPRILTAGIPQYPPNGVPYYIKDGAPPDLLKLLPQPSTPADAIGSVRQTVAGGADIIKLFTGSWISKQEVVAMPADVAEAAVVEAHRRGKFVFVHPSNVAGLEVALRAHADVVAHAIEDTRALKTEHLQRMVAQEMALIPTLHLFSQDTNIAEILHEVHDFRQQRGRILFGTDVGFLSDYDPTDEFVQLARAGLTRQEILASLTTSPASRFAEATKHGRIEKGLDGDLVVLRNDPFVDVRAFADVVAVVRGGHVVYQQP